ncbi:MAG TPA: hypothetical protein VGR19_06890 [Allosphingosinicella sp.]|nr:hypothetical protein [Allosphingosinicella sp.]
MRKFLTLGTAALLVASSPLAAQKIGARTAAPEQVLAQMGEGNSDAELERAIAAASAFPLGSLQYPVRVGGPSGQQAYLSRLRCADGSRPAVGQGVDGGTGGFGSIVQRFQLDCGSAEPGRQDLMMDKYHQEHRETRAPQGFRIEVS